MKNLGIVGKLMFFLNSVIAVLLLFGYLLPYIPPRILPEVSLLSLFLPVLLILNGLFVLYWVVRGKRQFLLSSVVLVLGVFHILSLFRLGSSINDRKEDVSILSYNVKGFNKNKSIDIEAVGDKIHAFIYKENPDIVCFQEFESSQPLDATLYPFTAINESHKKNKYGQIIYSKYPIVHSGSLNFEETYNGGIYADIAIKNDTVRVYNIHFQSLRISSNFNQLQKEETKSLVSRVGRAFKMQEEQLGQFLRSESQSPHPVVVAGDFNNSATSYLYRKIMGDKNDAFAKAGSGTGATYTFDFIPIRIDFILADPQLEIIDFETYDIPLSDHKPIRSFFALK